MAAEFAAGRRLTEVECITADARHTGLGSGSFDLVHARTLLVNIPEPEQVVTEMARLARPGGWVAAMEPDSEYAMCYPPNPAFTQICAIFRVFFDRNGADHMIGRRVAELFRQAGLTEVGSRPGRRCIRPATPGARPGWNSYAACAPGSWRWGWPPRPSWVSSTLRSAPTSLTPHTRGIRPVLPDLGP